MGRGLPGPARIACAWAALLLPGLGLGADDEGRFRLADVFQLEHAADPRIAPDGRRVAFVRNAMDIRADRVRSSLWILDVASGDLRPLTDGPGDRSPRWSPDGERLAYISDSGGSAQIHVRWMDTGQSARLTDLDRAADDLAWSPDGAWIAFSTWVPEPVEPFVELPERPDGAEWAAPPRVIRKLLYRADGRGYLDDGYRQLFVLRAEGGTPRQVTRGPYDHGGTPSWSRDSQALIFSANRHEDWEYDPNDTEVYRVRLADGSITPLTDRRGPDDDPVVSPDGRRIAYRGFEDRYQGYQVTRLWVMNADGSERRCLTQELDRSVRAPQWSSDGRHVLFAYSDHGNTKIGAVDHEGRVRTLAGDVGGTSLGRPYASGSFSVARDGTFAYTRTRPEHPADVAVGRIGEERVRRLTDLNADLFGHKELGRVEQLRFRSAHDGREIQGWVVRPPGFDAERTYPLILEIHGGPFADYGDRFAAEIQLYAAAGYVVLYLNPRGSTSYGEEFGNLIHHAYPGHDYDDLMSGVDAVLEQGSIDPRNLFVTGGSGGGVLTAWIVGKTDRFRAAVVAKPVINWYSFVLTADAYNFFYRYWFPGFPWEHPEHYLARSPLSLVGHVKTPTMLLTGEQDYRTPISESEQYYQALKLRRIDTALVRIPEASHGIARRPSQMIAKVAHILEWFGRYRDAPPGDGSSEREAAKAHSDTSTSPAAEIQATKSPSRR